MDENALDIAAPILVLVGLIVGFACWWKFCASVEYPFAECEDWIRGRVDTQQSTEVRHLITSRRVDVPLRSSTSKGAELSLIVNRRNLW